MDSGGAPPGAEGGGELEIPVIDLTNTWGVIFIMMVMETLLYGMGVLQVWLYFLWYPKDAWKIKLTVIWLLAVETVQITLYTVSAYYVFVTNYMNPTVLTTIKPIDTTHFLAGYISSFTVQLYFAYTIYKLEKKSAWNKLAVAAIVTLAFISVGNAIGLTVVVGKVGDFTGLGKAADHTLAALQSGSAVLCDIIITIALTTSFRMKMDGISRTNAMLQTLTVNAVNRGMLTATCAVLDVTLFLSLPGTLYYFIGQVLSGKLYMNSMMATLNTRHRIRKIAGGDEVYSMNVSLQQSGRPELSTMAFEGKSGHSSTNVASVGDSKSKNSLFKGGH